MLSNDFVPWILDIYGKRPVGQDNNPCYSSRYTQQCMNENGMHTIPCPERSPDLNIIENVWDMMARIV